MKKIALRLAVLVGAGLTFHAAFSQPAPVRITPPPKANGASGAQAKPAQPALKGFPFTNESLSYTVNWPSGLSLGEVHTTATGTPTGWNFQFTLDAAIPGFAVKDSFESTATKDLCSETFHKNTSHGAKKSGETVSIDQQSGIATRTPANGVGASKVNVSACVRDALTFLFYARRELGQGRVPLAQEIIFGAVYNGSFEYAGAATINVGGKPVLSDKIICHIRGPASDNTFEAYFDRDPARTPLSVRVPLAMGKFSLELVR
ncbi:MAG TPA: DUF3108 domain-containing protein [Bryobacteraceae bacterium]|nr:DUF3108 domain-containing protein [Bryobacteraceae bacterium]